MLYNQYYPFQIIPLEYEYSALEPEIGEYTVFFHFNEHYLPALEKLNALVEEVPVMQNMSLEELAENSNTDIKRAAGSVFAHELYFSSLTDDEQEPSEYMKKLIKSDFGSEEGFKSAVKKAAEQVYGSGFVWIVRDKNGILMPVVTANHDIPNTERLKPVYNIDLWEHSYYLDRQNHRDNYVDAALERINWDEFEQNVKS